MPAIVDYAEREPQPAQVTKTTGKSRLGKAFNAKPKGREEGVHYNTQRTQVTHKYEH